MTAKHTPGPWHRNIKPVTKYPTIFSGRNTHIIRIETRGLSLGEAEANMCLAMAAPDLLAALKFIMGKQPYSATQQWRDNVKIGREMALAAIARAEGAA